MARPAPRPAGAGGIKSVAKVLDILEYLAAEQRPVGASEIARAVGFHVSTTHRLLRTLAARGYVEQHAERRHFSLGPQLLALGNAYAGAEGLADIARPELEALRDAQQETIHLGIYRDGVVIEVASASGTQPVSVSLGTGRRDPAHCTALGKVLLAHSPDAEVQAFFARGTLERRTPRSIVRKGELLAAFERARKSGYATDDEELASDMCCVGVPVHDRTGRVVAALSIAMPKSRFRPGRVPQWVKALSAAAARIGERLRPGAA